MRALSAVVVSLLVFAVAPATAGAAKWVGLGDSFAAGPLIPNQSLSPLGCLRSSKNFARLAAPRAGHTLTDVSCSGAKTDAHDRVAEHERGHQPAAVQRARRRRRTVVSLQIGGNDIGFTEILQNCVTYEPVRDAVPEPLQPGRQRRDRGADRRDRAEGRRGPRGHPPAVAGRAGPRRQLRRDPARQRHRLLAAGAARLLRRALPARASRSELNAMLEAAGGGQRRRRASTTTRRVDRPRRVPVAPARAGSSRWCPATPPRRSIPTPAAWRASRRWSRRRPASGA